MKSRSRRGSSKVNYPSHYNVGKIEVIEFLEDQGLTNDFYLSTAVKYICRARFKGDLTTDLQKAVWYLQRRIKREHPPR